ncbi:hypothetical protein M3666_11230 [Curtobacterium sp. ODYSSEY 48 V2]|uniref:hypothetical protein n=1 Tax=Curtobacterium sp. ODYSSEY 48 V2 TaxID=2939561 RepID=UPI00203F3E21|nr:hypothetical protein [Curtobacterium sp. ODYSSEY 48 V2]MCM3505684.1 hypothetical protein [Curtobacterium sp. ODYSSEY 48 V2]
MGCKIGLLIASVVVVAGAVVPVAQAHAEPNPVREAKQLLQTTDFDSVLRQLRAADLVESERDDPDGHHTVITLGDGLELDVLRSKGDARLGGGYDAGGHYVTFNQYDQNLLYNGAGFALGAAICAIPAVGQLACLAVQAIIAVGAAYLATIKGTCKNNKRLKVYFSNNHAARTGCV